MWNQVRFLSEAAVIAAVGVGAGGCGPPSSRYRDELSHYDRAAASRAAVDDGRELFAGQAVLGLEGLVDAVLARNPNVEHARAGWRAALARYPQATSFEDPMLSYKLAPLSVASSDVDLGQVIELSQPLPYPGKRRLRGQVVLAEAEAAKQDYQAVRLRLALMAAHFYYELYTTDRAIAISAELARELESHRQTLTAHLAAGHAWQDDLLKVDVDLGETIQKRIDLEGEREVLAAQVNELLHRAPELPLPALPESLEVPAPIGEASAALQASAVGDRPELRAAAARRDLEDARIAVAEREFYPDFRVMGSYNSMWGMFEHELMVGVAVTVPLWRDRRHAAVDEAEALRDRAIAEVALVEDRIRTEVERALRAYTASLSVLETYRSQILPAAEARVESIRVGLESGRTTFIEVLRADHDLFAVQLRYERALANAYRRRADLDIALGRIGGAK